MPNFRYISWSEYGNLAEALAEKVRANGRKYDLVVGIARGGIPVAMVVSDHLNVKIDFVNVKSYTEIGKRAAPRILSTLTGGIEGKDILLVDDLVDQGDTLSFMKKYLMEQKPRSLETAVMFKKPWSKTEPDYFLETVSEWVVFPFELGEVGRERAAMEKGPGEGRRAG
ncbi:MAG: phosphoribosyltransferase [Nitrososphaerota archaeon]|nr:phosphoribosyltransferase [Nitrososphaerota archaeon]